ncbi:hypothetical protein B0H67DRAFT_359096 [Lasiosphaeris hirsuta]|uniref:Uncharacterized protein n=1 Tax=Lasiosphaeris hirsuta TaxID=260670 RepID=A0AA40DIU3_9PEZI|nr:hypothetical protein B0H67DRAFT_359096 [Lasiosphaeris hirsuta]
MTNREWPTSGQVTQTPCVPVVLLLFIAPSLSMPAGVLSIAFACLSGLPYLLSVLLRRRADGHLVISTTHPYQLSIWAAPWCSALALLSSHVEACDPASLLYLFWKGWMDG